jgi:serine phosphatase RsbU (regulator of sigma subunit)/HAMP domain-containing protein
MKVRDSVRAAPCPATGQATERPKLKGAGAQGAGTHFDLRFAATRETIQGVLGMAQEWAASRDISRADQGSLRLVLEELLLNICFHASPNPARQLACQTELFIGLYPPFPGPETPDDETYPWQAKGERRIFLRVRDTGQPFNPLEHVPASLGANPGETQPGDRGLSFVRLLSIHGAYSRQDGLNTLFLILPLSDEEEGAGEEEPRAASPRRAAFWLQMLERGAAFRFWRSRLAVRQTAVLVGLVTILLWGGIFFLHQGVNDARRETAAYAGEQSIAAMARELSGLLHRLEERTALMAGESLRASDVASRNVADLLAENGVCGLVRTEDSRSGHWVVRLREGALSRSRMSAIFLPAWGADAAKGGSAWQGPLADIPPGLDCGGGALFFAVPCDAAEGMALENGMPCDSIGVLVASDALAAVAQRHSAFQGSLVFLLNRDGEYLLQLPGASQRTIAATARILGSEALGDLGRAMLHGEVGAVRLPWNVPGEVLDADDGPLLWDGPTTVFYRPVAMPGRAPEMFLGLAVPSRSFGDAPILLPWHMIALGIAGPLLFGALAWRIFSQSVRPVRELSDALHRMARGDLDTPLTVPSASSETGPMLLSFERAHLALRSTLHALVAGTTAQERLTHELAVTGAIQKSILPSAFPLLPGYDVYARTDMACEVCGDLYDCFVMEMQRNTRRLCCMVGDVSGKGMPAATLMSGAMSLIRSALLEGLDPAGALARVNTALARNNAASMFVTMLAGVLELETGTFVWASAGHPPPIRFFPGDVGTGNVGPGNAGKTGQIRTCDWPGELPLGIRDHVGYSTFSHTLVPGEVVLLYTDGVTEAAGPESGNRGTPGAFFGEEGLAASLAANGNAPNARTLLENIRADVVSHMAGAEPSDDITLMALRRWL